jgi:MFS-type transporter involved in bile tolerance (Atg22 family)
VVFLVIGSFADFGHWRPNILIVLSIIAWAIGFAWLGVHTSDKWEAGTGLYIVGLIGYQTTLTFWTAAFPGLARNTVEMKAEADAYVAGQISRDEYDYADTMKRSQLSNMAFYIQSVGEIVILAVIVGIMFGLNVNASTANNNWGLSVLIAFASGVWILLSLPWFFLEKRRPGQDPAPRNIIMAGLWQLVHATRQIWKLKQSVLYLIGYFLLGDSLNTTVTVIATLQNTIVAYNTLELTYLLIVGIAAQVRSPVGVSIANASLNSGTGSWHLRLLADPATIPIGHKDHVQRCRCRHHPAGWMGHDRQLDQHVRLPQPVGSLGKTLSLFFCCFCIRTPQANLRHARSSTKRSTASSSAPGIATRKS